MIIPRREKKINEKQPVSAGEQNGSDNTSISP